MKWSLYEMIPRRVCVKIQVPHRTKNPCTHVRYGTHACVRSGLPCRKWSLYKIVFVRSDLTPFVYICITLHVE